MTDATRTLLRQARDGDARACEQLVEENNGLIWAVARRYFGRGVEPDDLYQLASLGFVKAVRGYDDAYGTEFSTYAVPKIAGEIRRFMRDDGAVKVSRAVKEQAARLRRLQNEMEFELGREVTVGELAARAGISAEEAAACEQATGQVDSLQRTLSDDGASLGELLGDDGIEDRITLRLSLQQALADLPERERQVIALRYEHDMTQAQAAAVIGVSQVQISRIERKAIDLLRREII
ncbi:MAG: sigma-70 family RNA polymerase sigma factor [Clostridiaceae bacterium]|nr:sigma-70 family RNA polymerase sigma factor [Clostridiaceae bacterium]